MLSNLFYEASINLLLKLDNDIIRKKNYIPVSFMNMDAKILNKVLENHTQQCIKIIIYEKEL